MGTTPTPTVDQQVHVELKSLIIALESKPAFAYQNYGNRLQSAVQGSAAVSSINANLPNPLGGSADATFDGQDCSLLVSNLAVASCAYGISQANDAWGFAGTVNGTTAKTMGQGALVELHPYMFAEDINNYLSAQTQRKLNDYMALPGFIDAYNAIFTSAPFMHKVVLTDATAGNNNLATTLLFVQNYFASRGTYSMLQSLDSSQTPLAGDVLMACGGLFAAGTLVSTMPDPVAWATISIASVFSGNPDIFQTALAYIDQVSPLLKQLDASFEQVIQDAQDKWNTSQAIDSGAIDNYVAMTPYLNFLWASCAIPYTDAMQEEIGLTNVKTSNMYMPGGGFGAPALQSILTTATTYGVALASWMSVQRDQGVSCFTSDPPTESTRTTYHRESSAEDALSYFIPGTLVYTSTGNKPIESLRENDRVLTDAKDKTYGLVSDESVVTSTATGDGRRIMIYGFNKEQPFFTAGHVFITTTGLRAINPVLARKENPWLTVGRLQIGHYLLRAVGPGMDYKPVQVRSLHYEEAKAETVHGVHLREGLRTYHANGYLVRVNYPEITIRSVAKDILRLPRKQRTAVLHSCNSIAPIFQRFGGQTVIDMLRKEALTAGRTIGSGLRDKVGVLLQHISRTWILKPITQTGDFIRNIQGLSAPVLSLIDGIVHINGHYCERSAVDESNISWSRPMREPGLWEHGVCTMRKDNITGSGLVFMSESADPARIPDSKDCLRFHAVMTRAPTSMPTSRPETVISKAVPKLAMFNASAITAAPASATAPSSSSSSSSSTSESGASDEPEVFTLTYGSGADPSPSTPLFDIVSISTGSSGDTMVFPDVQIPVLDALLPLLEAKLSSALSSATTPPVTTTSPPVDNTTTPASDATTTGTSTNTNGTAASSSTKLNRLYDVVSWMEKGVQWMQVDLEFPELIYEVSDDAASANPTSSYENLTFKQLGYSGTLPILFRSFKFFLDWEGTHLQGTLKEYDPTSQGLEGASYAIAGKHQSHKPTATAARLSATQESLTSFMKAPSPAAYNALTSPATVLGNLMTTLDAVPTLSVSALGNIEFSNSDLHTTTQTLLYNTMLYHMSKTDRTTFGLPAKPTTLPSVLADGLAHDLQTWLVNVYARAFICSRLNNVSDATKSKWRRQFTSDEVKKLNYWWNGSGPNCLSQQPEYDALNQTCAAQGLLSLCPVLQSYLDDVVPEDGLTGGKKWSAKFLKAAKHHAALSQLHANPQQLTKFCNILHTLDSDKTNANALATAAINFITGKTAVQQVNKASDAPASQQQDFQWLQDCMGALTNSILTNPNFLGGDLEAAVQKDIKKLCDALNLDSEQDANLIAQAILEGTAGMIQSFCNLCRTIRNSPKPDTNISARDKGTGRIAKAAEEADTQAEAESKAAPGRPWGRAVGRGLLLVLGIAGFLYTAVGAYKNWTNLTATEKSTLVLTTMQLAATTINESYGIFRQLTSSDRVVAKLAGVAMDQNIRATLEMKAMDVKPTENNNAGKDTNVIGQETGEAVSKDAPLMNPNNEADGGSRSSAGSNSQPDVSADQETEEKMTKPAKSFNLADGMMRGFITLVGAAVTGLMIAQLTHTWGNLDLTSKILSVLQIVQQSLSFIVDTTDLAVEVISTYVVTGAEICETLALCCAWAGPSLAVVGIVLMIVMAFLESSQDPPLTPIEQWIQDTGSPFLDNLNIKVPSAQLVYTVPSQITSGQAFSLTASNNTATPVTLGQLNITFQGGNDPVTLFTEANFQALPSGTTFGPGFVQIAGATGYSVGVASQSTQNNAQGAEITTWCIQIWSGYDGNGARALTVPANSSFEIQIAGTESSTSATTPVTTNEVQANLDNCLSTYSVSKA